MRVLVTGGNGYIGNTIAHSIERDGGFAVRYDREPAWPAAAPTGPVEMGDVLDTERLRTALQQYQITAVVHCAGLIAVPESVAEPLKYWHQNVAGGLSLLRAMADAGVPHLVFSSTAAVYGEPEWTPLTEGHPLHPTNPYGRTKLTQEALFQDVAAATPLRYAALRYFNAAGRMAGIAGERHHPETHLIPLALEAVMTGRPLAIMGTDYPTPDGTAQRDYIHVADLAAAHVAALRYLARGGDSVALNLANRQAYSVRQVVDTVARVVGRAVPVEEAPRRAGDPAVLVGDPARAKELLGWSPRWERLEAMVESAWEWRQERDRRPGAV